MHQSTCGVCEWRYRSPFVISCTMFKRIIQGKSLPGRANVAKLPPSKYSMTNATGVLVAHTPRTLTTNLHENIKCYINNTLCNILRLNRAQDIDFMFKHIRRHEIFATHESFHCHIYIIILCFEHLAYVSLKKAHCNIC